MLSELVNGNNFHFYKMFRFETEFYLRRKMCY